MMTLLILCSKCEILECDNTLMFEIQNFEKYNRITKNIKLLKYILGGECNEQNKPETKKH